MAVVEAGRVDERSRWRRLPSAPVGPRVHPLLFLRLADAAGLDAVYLVKAEAASAEDVPMWVQAADFPEVPRTVLDPTWRKQKGHG